MINLSLLNENQRAAVLWDAGALLVLAGPGSGKTSVLTYRIARLLEESPKEHFRILALTFTNKAAAEMRGRVEKLVPNALNRVRLTTFHSFAAELLQQHGSHIDLSPNFQILSTDADRIAVLDQVLSTIRKDLSLSLPEHFQADQLLPVINKLLEKCVPSAEAQEVLQRSNVEAAIPLSGVYSAYREALRKTNALDFPSLIAETIYLLKRYPSLGIYIRKVYKHILVDEFQDTNSSQYQFLSLIVRPDSSTFFVVADDDQIIYQWNGANPKRLHELRKEFAVTEIQLPENYRCPSVVIKLANSLISQNLNRSAGKKPLKAVKKGDSEGVLRIYNFKDISDEAKWISKDIAQRLQQGIEGCAVLARTKKFLDFVGKEISLSGLPVYFGARKDEFKSSPLQMLHSILRLANSQEDKQSLARLCKSFYEIEGLMIEQSNIFSKASADGISFLRAWIEEAKQILELEKETLELLTNGIKPLLTSLNFRAFATNFFEWAEDKQIDAFVNDGVAFNEFEEEKEVWQQLLNEITKKFEGEEISLYQFLRELDLTSKTPPIQAGAIPCFTIHASKGMEFKHVYLMGLVEDQLPSWAAVKKGDNSLEMQEERRNCFVAITRAQESLTMTFSENVFGWKKEPSRFLNEMGISI
jgi:DNA helicase II / ATP-dependent DNA helicase PcrA